MRGQAFVTFLDTDSAERAIKEQGFPLFNKPLAVAFAKKPADIICDDKQAAKQAREECREEQEAVFQRMAEHAEKQGKLQPRRSGLRAAAAAPQQIPDEYLPPNKILFLRDVAEEVDGTQLENMFKRFPGFKEVRLVPGKSDIAFVEFETEMQSSVAKDAMHGALLGAEKLALKVTFARK